MSAALRGPQLGGSGWVSEEGRGGAHPRRSVFADSHGGDGEPPADDDSHKYRGDKPSRLDAVNTTAPGRVSDRQARPVPAARAAQSRRVLRPRTPRSTGARVR